MYGVNLLVSLDNVIENIDYNYDMVGTENGSERECQDYNETVMFTLQTMGNNLCATWQKGYRDGCDWPPRKDAHLIRSVIMHDYNIISTNMTIIHQFHHLISAVINRVTIMLSLCFRQSDKSEYSGASPFAYSIF